jgi:hypothetical protein
MPLRDVGNAMRAAAETWAQGRGLAFVWDNGAPKHPAATPTLVWSFEPGSTDRLTADVVRATGQVVAEVWVPAGSGALAALGHGENLLASFRGQEFAGAAVLDEGHVAGVEREGPSYVVEVLIPWEFDERRVPPGTVGAFATPGVVAAYQAFRERWEAQVRAPLGLPTFFDNSPPATESPPWAICAFRILQPNPIELRTMRVPGRVIAALNHPIGRGVSGSDSAIATIVRAFDQCGFRGLTFGTPDVTRVGRTPFDTWQANVRLPFHYEVTT